MALPEPSFLISPASHNAFKLLSTLVELIDGISSIMPAFVNLPILVFVAFLTISIAEFLSDINSALSSMSSYALAMVPSRKIANGVTSSRLSCQPIWDSRKAL